MTVSISVERYVAIFYPLVYKVIRTANNLFSKKMQYKLVHIEENHPLVCLCRREAMVGVVVDPVCGGILCQ